MSEEQLKAFLAKVKDDPTLHDKLKSAQTVEHIVEIDIMVTTLLLNM